MYAIAAMIITEPKSDKFLDSNIGPGEVLTNTQPGLLGRGLKQKLLKKCLHRRRIKQTDTSQSLTNGDNFSRKNSYWGEFSYVCKPI